MTQDYRAALCLMEENPELTVDIAASGHCSNLKWDRALKDNLKRKKMTEFDEEFICTALYRPFVATNCYTDFTFVNRKYQIDRIFPESSSENRVICVTGIGSTKQFSVLVCDTMPDVQLIANGQCFPRYRYRNPSAEGFNLPGVDQEPGCIENISGAALRVFCEHYRDDTITKDAIFDYVYGVLHTPSYGKQFANDLSKELPRIPFAPDFYSFAEGGKALGELHLGYERCERYPLEVVFPHEGGTAGDAFRGR